MRNKIESKINEVIDYIVSKQPEDITYNEYRILDNKLASFKYDDERKERDMEMAELLGRVFKGSSNIPPSPLPDALGD